MEWTRAALDLVWDAVLLCDPATKRILAANASFRNLLGYAADELEPLTLYDILKRDREDIDSHVQRVMAEGRRAIEERTFRRKDGSAVEVQFGAARVPFEGREALCVVARDIADYKRMQEKVALMPYHDFLTDLPNHRMFEETLSRTVAQAHRRLRKLAVLSLDVDLFKRINDKLGHAVGNLLLQGIAARLKKILRKEDVVSRTSGDQFMLLLPEIGQANDAARAVLRIQEALKPPFTLEGNRIPVTVSVGISLFPEDGEESQSLMRSADSALYQAKSKGRNTYCFRGPEPRSASVAS